MWLEHLLTHQFRMGLDRDLHQACVYRGVPAQLQDWFRVVTDLDMGLQELRAKGDRPTGLRKPTERPMGLGPGPSVTTGMPRSSFRCFRCNQPGHRVTECPVPVSQGKPESPGKVTPKRTPEKLRAAHQAEGSTPHGGGSKEDATTATRYRLVAHDSEAEEVEDPMVSEPI